MEPKAHRKEPLKIAVAQFETKDGDKTYNLEIIRQLARRASEAGADVVSFHELSTSAYTFLRDLDGGALKEMAEGIPEGEVCQHLLRISSEFDLALLAGILEADEGQIYNTYVCAHRGEILARFRKLHPFIHPEIHPGNSYETFELFGWQCGILICYDNNVIENVRATTLLGAEILFAPHVTGCTPSSMPGRGYVDPDLWKRRVIDPVPLRKEFDGPKGREWLMRWLPARAYDNGIYLVFINPVGMEGTHLKNGNSMILDPYGEVVCEIKSFNNDIAIAPITSDKLKLAGGFRYRNARRPELYGNILSRENTSVTKPVWLSEK